MGTITENTNTKSTITKDCGDSEKRGQICTWMERLVKRKQSGGMQNKL